MMSKGRRRARRLAIAVAAIVVSFVLIFVGVNVYLLIAERLDPSGRVYVVVDGQRTYLEQPTALVTPSPKMNMEETETVAAVATASSVASDSDATPTSALALPEDQTPKRSVPLPPLRLDVPSIGVDVPVVLTRHDQLPRQPLAGWLFKSAFPATAGNMVVLGHLDGAAAVFEHLGDLQAGDEIRVETADATHVYIVDRAFVVADDEVGVLAPTDEAVITMVTCAGDWNATTKSYSHRLIVRGHYELTDPLEPPTFSQT